MHLSLLVLALIAPAQDASPPITVTGHAWAPFISPMGEPFRARSASDDTLARWFAQADRNRDGALTSEEMQQDAERFFAQLDTTPDAELDPEEIAYYEYEVAPDIQVMSRTRPAPGQAAARRARPEGLEMTARDRRRQRNEDEASLGFGGALQGGARYGLLNMPQPVIAADADFNRGVSREEFRKAAIARFQLLDKARLGRLGLAQLQAMRPVLTRQERRRLKEEAVDTRIGNPLPTRP